MKKINNLHGIKIGKTLNVFINGELNQKSFDSLDEANKAYQLFLSTKENPTDKNILELLTLIKGVKFNLAHKHGLDYNLDNGEVYLEGFKTKLPKLLIETFEDYDKNNFPVDAIKNFWNLLMCNPDENVRSRLFNYINEYNLVITENGYFLAYKAVSYKENKIRDNDLSKFVQDKFLIVKNVWKTNPNRYTVYKSLDNVFMITKTTIFKQWDLKEKGVIELGNLSVLFDKKDKLSIESKTQYTDKHTKKMNIEIGVPCKMPRNECDNNIQNECSIGLHVGATKYVNNFSNQNDQILMCLINPAHVVAIPKYDNSKIRVSEYFPFSISEKNADGTIKPYDTSYFENDYIEYEKESLKEMVINIKADEAHIKTKDNIETRSNSDMLDIIINRVTILT